MPWRGEREGGRKGEGEEEGDSQRGGEGERERGHSQRGGRGSLVITVLYSTCIDLQLSSELYVSSCVYLNIYQSGVSVGVRVHSDDLLSEYGVTVQEMRHATIYGYIGILDYPEVDESIILPFTPAGVGVIVEGGEESGGAEDITPRLQSKMFYLLLLGEIKRVNDIVNKCHQGFPFINIWPEEEALRPVNIVSTLPWPDVESPLTVPLDKLTYPLNVFHSSVDDGRLRVVARAILL